MKKVLIVGIFTFMTKWNFMLSWVEHEKKFYNLGAWSLRVIRRSLHIDKIHKNDTLFLIISTLSSKYYKCYLEYKPFETVEEN